MFIWFSLACYIRYLYYVLFKSGFKLYDILFATNTGFPFSLKNVQKSDNSELIMGFKL